MQRLGKEEFTASTIRLKNGVIPAQCAAIIVCTASAYVFFAESNAVNQAPLNVRLASPIGRGGTVEDCDGEGLTIAPLLRLIVKGVYIPLTDAKGN